METDERATATLGGGCFWCLEAVYEEVPGVEQVVSGYAGGNIPDPSYYEVCSGRTGHAEVVQITYDPQRITFRELLEVFFIIHDPTTLNRQGADVGTQYRSIILYHNDRQKDAAIALIDELSSDGAFSSPIVTEIAPFSVFWPAENEHQGYYRNNPGQGYCRIVIDPKLSKFRKVFSQRLG